MHCPTLSVCSLNMSWVASQPWEQASGHRRSPERPGDDLSAFALLFLEQCLLWGCHACSPEASITASLLLPVKASSPGRALVIVVPAAATATNLELRALQQLPHWQLIPSSVMGACHAVPVPLPWRLPAHRCIWEGIGTGRHPGWWICRWGACSPEARIAWPAPVGPVCVCKAAAAAAVAEAPALPVVIESAAVAEAVAAAPLPAALVLPVIPSERAACTSDLIELASCPFRNVMHARSSVHLRNTPTQQHILR